MGNVFGVYFFFFFTLALCFAIAFGTKGTMGVRNLFIKSTEYTLYVFVFGAMLAGGFLAGPFGGFIGGEGGMFIAMILGAAFAFVLSIPIVTMVLLQIDIAASSRKAADRTDSTADASLQAKPAP